MSKIVFILGAGASKEAGAPLMFDFLDVADGLRGTKEIAEWQGDFDLVFKAIAALRPAYANANVDLTNNIESVFAAFEMARLIGRLDSLSTAELMRLPTAMRRLIEVTLEQTIKFPVYKKRVLPPAPYDVFAQLLNDIVGDPIRAYGKISIITFNYDICVDYALHSHHLPVDYGLQGPPKNVIKLLKLHGSLNWAYCSVCSQVVPWDLSDFFLGRSWQLFDETKTAQLNIAANLSQFKHCEKLGANAPFIVPPVWNKMQYHEQLSSVWRAAVDQLTDAEYIIVCGYSLPATDHFFRFLYALGTVGDTRLKGFWVFGPEGNVEPRFRELLGPVVLSRFGFFPMTFKSALAEVRSLLKVQPR